MNCFKWDENISDRSEETPNQDIPNPVMVSSTHLTSTSCPAPSSNNIPMFMSAEYPRTTENVYQIETVVSTYTTPVSPYKYTRQNSAPSNSPEFIKKFAKDKRYWENVSKTKKVVPGLNGISFIVMSYNILAPTLLVDHIYLYKGTSRNDLEWNNRWRKMKSEISRQNPSIICLQEVETSYLDDIGNFLNSQGFKGIFKQKTGVKVDGCAIFFKSSLFDIVDYMSVEYMQPGITLLNRDNIGMMLKLRSKSNKDLEFVVCTTHLLYNPKRIDVRLAQMQLFLAEIDRFSYRENNGKGDHLPVIMTGDLNSFPNTPVTNLIDRGNIDVGRGYPNLYDVAITNACQHLEIYLERLQNTSLSNGASSMLYHSEVQKDYRKSLVEQRYSFDEYRHLFQNDCIKHHLNFTSVYDHVKENGEEEATSFHNKWVTVDYIYYSTTLFGNLEVVERYRLPTADECAQLGNIPNSFYGSDHLALVAKFVLTPCNPDTENKSESSV